jgi:segregation and condensation protein B
MMADIKSIIESLLFVAEAPLTINRLKTVLDISDASTIREAINRLTEDYETRKGGFHLRRVADGYQICTRPEYGEWIKRLIQPNPPRLSKAALETLAIVAYKQPIIRNDIEHIRGVDCGGILRQLLERKIIRILGRKEIPGRPLIYATTKDFLEIFDLKDLKDLPSLKEIDAFGNALAEAVEPENPTEAATDATLPPREENSEPISDGTDPETITHDADPETIAQEIDPEPITQETDPEPTVHETVSPDGKNA